MPNFNTLSEQNLKKYRSRLLSLGISAALCFTPLAAFAVCSNHNPVTGETVICDTTAPAISTTSVHVVAGSSNVTITVDVGAGISTAGAAVRVENFSTVTNNGSITTNLLNGYGIWTGTSANPQSTTIGHGNTLTNNGSITTNLGNSRGLYARTRNATEGNTLNNTGTITTNGTNAAGIRTESRANSTITNSGTVTTNNTGSNGIEMVGLGSITNTNTITSTQGYGVLGSDLVLSGVTYSGITLDNSGAISGALGAILLGTGADTVIIRSGSVLTGSIDGGGTASAPAGSKDQFIFNGFSSASFNNVITNFDLLHATGNADVGLSAASYSFDQVQIDAGASLAFIDTALTAPSGIINNGALTFSNSTPNAFGGPISGNGDLFKEDVGTFTLSGTNTYSGATAVVGGTLQAGAPNTFSPNSAVTVSAGTVLDLNDFNQTVFGLTNTGLVDMGASTVGTQLTTTDYVGGGTIAMNTVLDAGSSSDTLVITGTLSGATILDITNFGGAGAYTTGNGILVVNASSATIAASASFTLAAPLVVGGHEYTLHKGGVGGSNPQNWYLRNPSPRLTTAVPTLNPVALVLLALALTGLAFWRRRRV